MLKNVGKLDKIARIVVGLGLLGLIFVLEGNLRWLGLVGILPLLTVVISWCPGYAIFGIKTNKSD